MQYNKITIWPKKKILYLNQHVLDTVSIITEHAINHNRSHIILFSSPNPLIKSDLGSLVSNVKPAVRDLGVLLYSYLTFDPQIKRVVQSCFLQIRTISRIKPKLSHPYLKLSFKFLSYFILFSLLLQLLCGNKPKCRSYSSEFWSFGLELILRFYWSYIENEWPRFKAT